MSDRHYGLTTCPTCGKLLPIIDGESEEIRLWQYICMGTPEAPCGTAFKFEVKKEPTDE